ncbi:MAG TPA: hypothetical protein VF771_15310, partial [Longimicrobiaceae bacterium]
MIRSVIQEAAVSAAKAYQHAEVEPRHVLYALARHFRQRPDCEAYFAPAKKALEPSGSNYGTPKIGEAATALIDTLKTDDDGLAALRQGMQSSGDAGGGAAGTQ